MTKIHKLFTLIPDNSIGSYIAEILSLDGGLDISNYNILSETLQSRKISYGYHYTVIYAPDSGVSPKGSAYVSAPEYDMNPTPVIIKNTSPETIAKALAYSLLDLLLTARHELDIGRLSSDDFDRLIAPKD